VLQIRQLIVSLLVLFAAITQAQGGFTIKNYGVEIDLSNRANLGITERIQVEFNQPRRGIFREIPVEYALPQGNRRFIHVSNVQVAGHNYKLTQEGKNVRIRIGDANITHPAGTVIEYQISYQVSGAINWFENEADWDKHAELYWNLAGPGWSVPIERVEFKVTYPLIKSAEVVRARLYSGPLGSKTFQEVAFGKSGGGSTPFLDSKNGTLTGITTQTLNPGEAVSLVLGVPATVIPEPPIWSRLSEYFRLNWGYFLPIGLIAILFPIWFFFGRDPKLGPPGVRFDPPSGISPAFAGVLIDDKVDGRDVTAAIMSVAVKGYIKFKTDHPHGRFEPKTSYLIRTKKTDLSELTPFEARILNVIDPGNAPLPVQHINDRLRLSGSTIAQQLENKLIDNGFYRNLPRHVKGAMGQGFFLIAFGLIWGAGLISGILVNFGVMPTMASLFVGLLLCIPVAMFFTAIMPARTKLGAIKHRECVAFYEAMRRRAHYHDWFTKTNLDQTKYEQYLPYAVAFGLVNEWSNICRDVVVAPPSFIETNEFTAWDYMIFHSTFNHSLYDLNNSATSSLAPPQRSDDNSMFGDSGWSGGSGFGDGGGFSGGGFGGGGGDSW
jgi:uncharacterized membrane protein YgcG